MAKVDNAHYYRSSDGLKLYYREFGSNNSGTPVICLPGLTRNSRDFEDLAIHIASRRRVLTPDLRGRGYSEYDPNWKNYHPTTYVNDAWQLLDHLAIDTVLVIGTSLGGLCAMGMAATNAQRLAGVIMNDIGPDVHAAGLDRIKEYTGRTKPVTNWDEAVVQTRELYGDWLPGLSDADWRKMAWKAYREGTDGIPRVDCDSNIGRAAREAEVLQADPWALFAALADVPTMLLWGEMSDILTQDIVDKMVAVKADLDVVAIPNRGHAPLLDEPQSMAAIDRFLDEVP